MTKPLDFSSDDWAQALREYALTSGLRQMHAFIDFFVFPKGFYDQVPRLVVGRWYWDQWLVWKALAKSAPVVDGTEFFVAVHQNHGYAYHPQGQKGTGEDALAMRNRALAGNGRELKTLLDVTHKLTRWGAVRRVFFRRPLSEPHVAAGLQFAMDKTFHIRKRIGLRKKTISKLSEKILHRTPEIRGR